MNKSPESNYLLGQIVNFGDGLKGQITEIRYDGLYRYVVTYFLDGEGKQTVLYEFEINTKHCDCGKIGYNNENGNSTDEN